MERPTERKTERGASGLPPERVHRELADEITRLLDRLDERKLSLVYRFVLSLN